MHLTLERAEAAPLRGEPAPASARATGSTGTTSCWDAARQHAGVALSYLNLFDADAAWRLAHELAADAGARGRGHRQARQRLRAPRWRRRSPTPSPRALAADELSAFGGVVAITGDDRRVARRADRGGPQADVVIARALTDEAREAARRADARPRGCSAAARRAPPRRLAAHDRRHRARPGRRRLRAAPVEQWRSRPSAHPTDAAAPRPRRRVARVRDARRPTRSCSRATAPPWASARASSPASPRPSSPSRRRACAAKGAAAASDAFFPFPDGLEALADAGVTCRRPARRLDQRRRDRRRRPTPRASRCC